MLLHSVAFVMHCKNTNELTYYSAYFSSHGILCSNVFNQRNIKFKALSQLIVLTFLVEQFT